MGGLVAAAWLWSSQDRTVSLAVDGQTRAVQTFGGTVAAALADANVHVGPHDAVVPALASRLHQGERIALARGRLLRLNVDGVARRSWVTGDTVAVGLAQLGLDPREAYVSLPLADHIGLAGAKVTVRLPQAVTVVVDGHVITTATTAPTVRALLAVLGVTLHPQDRISAPLDAYPTSGLVLQVVRVNGATVTADSPIGFAVVRRLDPNLEQGDDPVVQPGRDGVRVRIYQLTYLNHKLARKRLVRNFVSVQPVAEIIDEGTAAPPPPPPPPAPVSAYPVVAAGLNWGALAYCESSGNPQAVSADGQYYGLYQFSLSTWGSVGGSGYPNQASPAQQTYRAQLLYDRAGASAWPVCGRYL